MGDYAHSAEELDRKAALKRLSVALALRGVFAGVGLLEGEAGFGDFASSPSPEELQEHRYSAQVETVMTKLEQANGPYQIQACFTLSRALALVADPEI